MKTNKKKTVAGELNSKRPMANTANMTYYTLLMVVVQWFQIQNRENGAMVSHHRSTNNLDQENLHALNFAHIAAFVTVECLSCKIKCLKCQVLTNVNCPFNNPFTTRALKIYRHIK